MEKIEEKTIIDKPLYERVPSTKESVDNSLIDKLLEQDVDPDTITFEYKYLVRSCGPQIEVTAYGYKRSESDTIE